MSYVIAGRAFKNEHLTLGMYALVGGIIYASTGGKKTEPMPKPAKGQTLAEAVKETVPLNAASSEEEDLMNSIKKYIAEAEKEAGSSGH